MPNAHIAMRVDANILINQPEIVLQQMSFKILERREELLQKLIDTKVQFKANNCIEQGILNSFNSSHCNIKVGSKNEKVLLKRLLI